MRNIVAIVVTYNRKELLKECIHALKKQTTPLTKILIIDNHSTDGTEEYIKGELSDEELYYKYLEENIGGAGGFNIGIRKAVELGGDYLWIMDDDTIPENDSLSELLEASTQLGDDFGFLASKVLWKDGTPCLMNIPKVNEDWIYQSEYLTQGLVQLESASFVSLFVRKDAVMKCGLPIREFFIWGDDVEYTSRLSKEYKNYYCEKSVVVHKMNINERTDICTDSGTRLKRYEYLFRNMAYSVKKGGGWGTVKYVIRGVVTAFRIILQAKDNRLKRAVTVLKGVWKGIFFNPEIEYIK